MAGSGSGAPRTNRIVTFSEVNFSPNWYADQYPNPITGFVSHSILGETAEEQYGSVTITRSDGKVLSFELSRNDGYVVEIRENIIRFSSYERLHNDGPFL